MKVLTSVSKILLLMNNIRNIRRVYSTFVGLHHTLHYTLITLAHNIIAAEFSAISWFPSLSAVIS